MTTLDFTTSGGPELTGIGQSPTTDAMWHARAGTNASILSSGPFVRPGGRAIQWDTTAAAAQGYVQRTITGTQRQKQFYFAFPTLPNADTTIMAFIPGAGTFAEIRYRQATQDVVARIGAQVATAVPVVANQIYRVNVKYTINVGVDHTITWEVDGVAKGSATLAQAIVAAMTGWRVGISCAGNNVTGKFVFRDLSAGAVAADYPLAASIVDTVLLTGDGVHDFAAGAFKYSTGTDVLLAAIDTHTFLDHRLGGISDFIRMVNPLAGKYIENTVSGMPGADAINGMQVTLGAHASGLNANKLTVRIRDGVQEADVCTELDVSQTAGQVIFSKHYATRIGGLGALTAAAINGLRFRSGSSWTAPDVADEPRLGGIVLEVSYVPSSAPVVFSPVGLRLNLAVPAGLEGFDKTVDVATEGRRVRLHLGVPSFVITNPDEGAPVDTGFTAEAVIEAARDKHLAFDRQRNPTPLLLRYLDRYQRHLLAEALERDRNFMATTHTIPLPLGTGDTLGTREAFQAGYLIPFVYHLLLGGEVEINGLRTGIEFNLVSYGRRTSGFMYSGWVLGTRLYFRGDVSDWVGVSNILLAYVPTVPRLSSLRAQMSLPRSAEAAMVEQVAAFMAGRGHKDPQLPPIDHAKFAQDGAAAEAAWLRQMGNRRKSQVSYVREVW